MSNAIVNKRKSESDPSNEKNIKLSRIEASVDIDIEELKKSIRKEVSNEFEKRISKLEEEIKVLKSGKNEIENPFAKNNDKKEEEGNENSNNTSEKAVNSAPHFTTPTNSFTSATTQTPKDPTSLKNTPNQQPKHVFGLTTSFGSNAVVESMKNRKDIFSNLPSSSAQKPESPKPATTATSFGSSSFGSGSFGSNTKFGNAFKSSLNKKSFLDSDETEKDKENDKDSTEDSKGTTQQQYKQVDLNPVEEIKTGEENEKSLFNCTSKLFELDLDNISEGWKERGLGPLHLNQSLEDPKLVRIVMRSQGLLRVILNMKVTSETKLLKGLESSLSPGKFLRFNTLNEKGKPVQYMLKFGSQNLRDELFDKTTALQETVKETSKA